MSEWVHKTKGLRLQERQRRQRHRQRLLKLHRDGNREKISLLIMSGWGQLKSKEMLQEPQHGRQRRHRQTTPNTLDRR
jgi:hypothetical protein|tara:strand:- start:243 stop:476 length:234 start_codon:yes stop_codon:yes gene_type:complete